MNSEFLIEAERLGREYRDGQRTRKVLQEVNLQIGPGRFVAIMGPSGSGKSTLLHLLSGLDLPTSGRPLLLGHDLTKTNDEERTRLRSRALGFVFQFFNLVPHLTVAENVELPLLLVGVATPRDDPRFAEVLDTFELRPLLARRPHELSGGEMQRVSIARAVIHTPPLLFADEPTGNLSSPAGLRVMKHLRRQTDASKQTVLVVTHNPRDAAFADEVLFLRDGSLLEDLTLHHEDVRQDRIAARMESLSLES